VQIGYQLETDGSAYQRRLLDLPVHDEDEEAFEEARDHEADLYAGADAPQPYSLPAPTAHQLGDESERAGDRPAGHYRDRDLGRIDGSR
jgi:hypothetical protein